MIKQNVVFVENKAGSLKRVTGTLADNGINIYGFACLPWTTSSCDKGRMKFSEKA